MTTFQKFSPNEKRGVFKSCQICNTEFKLFGEHQCKRCIRAICENCKKAKGEIYKLDMQKGQNGLCTFCAKQSDFLINYIKENGLKFGQDSSVAKKWIKKIVQLTDDDQSKSNSQKGGKKLTIQTFNQMWNAYNFSLRQFIGLLTFERKQKEVFLIVSQVYDQLTQSGLEQKLQNILMLIMFMLCYSSPQNCCRLILYLYAMHRTVTDGKQLLQAYFKALSVEDSSLKRIQEYLIYRQKRFLGAFSVNSVSAECNIHLFSRVLEKGKIEQVYILLAMTIEDNLTFLIKNKGNNFLCDLELIRNCRLERFIEKYRLVGGVKTAYFILNNKTKKQQKSMTMEQTSSPSKSESMFSKNNKYEDYQISNQKSMSFKTYEPSLETANNDRKTTKIISERSNSQYTSYACQDCEQCDKKDKKIQQLQMKLKQKQKQIQNTNFKISLRNRKQSTDGFLLRTITPPQTPIKQVNENQILLQKLESTNSENISLKSRIQELEMNNKMYKNRLESESMFSRRKTQYQSGEITIDVLKGKLEQKNHQLQQLIKKNKLLEYQMKEMQKDSAYSKKQIKNQQFINKIQALTKQINDEQAQKLQMSQNLFNLRQSIRKDQNRQSQRVQCTIF